MNSSEFSSKLAEIGLLEYDPVLDGSHQRCPVEGKNGKSTDGFYFYDPTKGFGYAKNHKTGKTCNIFGENFKFSQEDIKKQKEKKEELNKKAVERANYIYNSLPDLKGIASNYLRGKGIKNSICPGLKQGYNNGIVIPARDIDGKIKSLSFIQKTGDKYFLKQSSYSGCFFSFGKDLQEAKYIHFAEGLATALSIRDLTEKSSENNSAYVVTFNVSNTQNVYQQIFSKLIDNKSKPTFLFYADFHKAPSNKPNEVGFEKYCEENNLHLYRLPEDYKDGSDFNDLVRDRGLDYTRHYLIHEFKKKEKNNEKDYER